MRMRIEKILIMLLLFASPILQAGQPASNNNQLPGEATRKAAPSDDDIRERAGILAAQAYALAESLLSQPSLNEQKKIMPVPSAPMPPEPPEVPEKTWCAPLGKTLKSSLMAWGKISGWSMKWNAEYDYPVLAEVCFKGSFEQAMEAVINAYQEAEYPLYLDIYPQQQLTVISH